MTSLTTTTLRLSPELAALAKARAESLGVSLNALVAFALDAYLRGAAPAAPAAAPASPPAARPAPAAPAAAPAAPLNRQQRRAKKRR